MYLIIYVNLEQKKMFNFFVSYLDCFLLKRTDYGNQNLLVLLQLNSGYTLFKN